MWVNKLFLNFQADESRIGYLQNEMKILLRKFMGKFVWSKVIQEPTSVSFNNSHNQLQDNIIAIGPATLALIIYNEEDISPSSLQRFFMFWFLSRIKSFTLETRIIQGLF